MVAVPDKRHVSRYIVCGDDRLVADLARLLLAQPDVTVTVVVPSDAAERAWAGDLSGTRLVITERLDREALHRAGLGCADAVILLSSGPVMRQALLVRQLNPTVRLIVRTEADDTSRPPALQNCTLLSLTAAAVEAYLAVLPSAAPPRRVALRVAARTRRPATMRRRLLLHELRTRATRIVAIALATVAVATALFVSITSLSIFDALYVILLKGFSEPDLRESGVSKIFDVCFDLLAVVGSVTAGVYIGDGIDRARALTAAGVPPKGLTDHVVIVGLGDLGTRMMQALHHADIDVVAVDISDTARGIRVARRLELPVLVDDGRWPETLRHAAVARCRALLLLTSDDTVNLDIALAGQGIRADLPIVWRPGDDETAALVSDQLAVLVPRTTPDDTVRYLAELVIANRPQDEQHRSRPIRPKRRNVTQDHNGAVKATMLHVPPSVLSGTANDQGVDATETQAEE